MAELETELSREKVERAVGTDGLPRTETPLVSFNRQGLLTFPSDRVYFGDFGLRPARLTAFSPRAAPCSLPLQPHPAAFPAPEYYPSSHI